MGTFQTRKKVKFSKFQNYKEFVVLFCHHILPNWVGIGNSKYWKSAKYSGSRQILFFHFDGFLKSISKYQAAIEISVWYELQSHQVFRRVINSAVHKRDALKKMSGILTTKLNKIVSPILYFKSLTLIRS